MRSFDLGHSGALALTEDGSDDGDSSPAEAFPSPELPHLLLLPELSLCQPDELGKSPGYSPMLSESPPAQHAGYEGLDWPDHDPDFGADLDLHVAPFQISPYGQNTDSTTILSYVDQSIPVTTLPGPANVFDGVPVQDS